MVYGRSPDIIGVDMSRGAGREILNGRQNSLGTAERGSGEVFRVEYIAAEPPQPPLPGETCVTCGTEAQADAEWPGGVRYDWTTRELTVRGELVHLTRTEGLFVRELVRAGGTPVSYSATVVAVWGAGYWEGGRYGAQHGIRVTLSRIRAKLRRLGAEGLIVTVGGVGYRVLVPSGRLEAFA